MAAPATTERTRAAAGAMPVNLKEAAPFWLKFEGVVVGAEEVPLVAGVDEADVRGVVVNAGVDKVDMVVKEPVEVSVDDGEVVVDAAAMVKGPASA